MGFNTFPCNPYPISTEELNKGNNDALNTRVTALEGDVSDLEEQKANQITIALPFNPETEYEVGDLVYYNGLTYRCTNEHTGEWDADDFAGTTIANELSALKSGLINPVGGIVTVTLPETSAGGYYQFFLPTAAFALGKTVKIVAANFAGDGTELKDYIIPEQFGATDCGKVYIIADENTTGVSSALYRRSLVINLQIS